MATRIGDGSYTFTHPVSGHTMKVRHALERWTRFDGTNGLALPKRVSPWALSDETTGEWWGDFPTKREAIESVG
jgi:hypothetical protein